MGPDDRRALGHGLSERRPAAAPSEPALRSRPRRCRAGGGAWHVNGERCVEAAGHDHRGFCDRLWSRSLVLRILPGTRCPAGLSLGRPHDGDAVVDTADPVRDCAHRIRLQEKPRAGGLMADDVPPVEAEIRRRIAAAGPMPVAQYMSLCLTHPDYGYYMTRDPL